MLLEYLVQLLPLGAAEGQSFLRSTQKRMNAKLFCRRQIILSHFPPFPTSGSCSSSKGLAVSLQNSHFTGYSVRGWSWAQCQIGIISDWKASLDGNLRWKWKLLLLEECLVGLACTCHTPACTWEFLLPQWNRSVDHWKTEGPPLKS